MSLVLEIAEKITFLADITSDSNSLCSLTLSLPIFWQFCSLSATFILTASGIVESQAYKFSTILFFLHFLSITFNKYPKFEVSKSIILWILHNVCKQRDLNKGWGGGPSRRSATLAVSAMMSPIGDVGSERVKLLDICRFKQTEFVSAMESSYHLSIVYLKCNVHVRKINMWQ